MVRDQTRQKLTHCVTFRRVGPTAAVVCVQRRIVTVDIMQHMPSQCLNCGATGALGIEKKKLLFRVGKSIIYVSENKTDALILDVRVPRRAH